jgi:hypothetical protein
VHTNILNLVKAKIAKVFTAAVIPAPQPATPASPAPLTIVASIIPNTPLPTTNSDEESNDTKLQVKKEKSPKKPCYNYNPNCNKNNKITTFLYN